MQHQPLLLFDGVCNLCSTLVRFVIQRESKEQLRFASLQSEVGRYLSREDDSTALTSMVLIENGRYYRKSAAALRIVLRLNKLWPLLYCFIVVPSPVRNMLYDFVGNRRYQWFGKTQQCWLPSAEIQQRFVEKIGDISESELRLMRDETEAAEKPVN